MGSMVRVHRVQYAVVEAHYSKARLERFVLAYEREKSLREFIAAPRIIASGFSSEKQAEDMLDAFDAHQGRLRRWLLPFEASLSTIAGYLVRFVRSLFWCETAPALPGSPQVPRAKSASCGTHAMVPSWFMISQITPAG
jgi:hypothetical protein